jgi:hypothetical protein
MNTKILKKNSNYLSKLKDDTSSKNKSSLSNITYVNKNNINTMSLRKEALNNNNNIKIRHFQWNVSSIKAETYQ